MFRRSRLELFVPPAPASTKSSARHCVPCAAAATAAESNERPNCWSRCKGYHRFAIPFSSASELALKYPGLVTHSTPTEIREQPSCSTYLTNTSLPKRDLG